MTSSWVNAQTTTKESHYNIRQGIIYNSMPRLSYYPIMWKFTQIIMLPKPGKSINEVNSYHPISLLPILLKRFKKLLLTRMEKDLALSLITNLASDNSIPQYNNHTES